MEGKRQDRKHLRRKFIDQTMEKIHSGASGASWECWQQQPYTAVRVRLVVAGWQSPVAGLGFAKVSWPDKWDEEEGQEIALQKAIASIWRQVMDAPLFEN